MSPVAVTPSETPPVTVRLALYQLPTKLAEPIVPDVTETESKLAPLFTVKSSGVNVIVVGAASVPDAQNCSESESFGGKAASTVTVLTTSVAAFPAASDTL